MSFFVHEAGTALGTGKPYWSLPKAPNTAVPPSRVAHTRSTSLAASTLIQQTNGWTSARVRVKLGFAGKLPSPRLQGYFYSSTASYWSHVSSGKICLDKRSFENNPDQHARWGFHTLSPGIPIPLIWWRRQQLFLTAHSVLGHQSQPLALGRDQWISRRTSSSQRGLPSSPSQPLPFLLSKPDSITATSLSQSICTCSIPCLWYLIYLWCLNWNAQSSILVP